MKSSIDQYLYCHFSKLEENEKKDLLELIAIISESSYRRGFQQGASIPINERTIEPETLRFCWAISKSPDVNGGRGMSSVDRVLTEFPQLENIGFAIHKP